MKDSTMDAAAQLPEKWRKAVRDVYGQGPAGAALLHCADELEAALTQQQGGEQEAGELLDIEVMRALFDSLPTSRAKDAYAAVKTYIDLCNENALRTKQPAASEGDDRPKANEVGRIGDMHTEHALRVGLDGDGDVYLSTTNGLGDGVEFCTTGNGGGKSPRTRDALIALMIAMEADNADDPRRDWWAQRNAPPELRNTSKQAAGEAVDFTDTPIWQPHDLRDGLQRKCSAWGVYWRAPDAHGVIVTVEQATELLADAVGVEVEITTPPRHPADEGMAMDAARYRWLRHKMTCGSFTLTEELSVVGAKSPQSFDAVVDEHLRDAALQAGTP